MAEKFGASTLGTGLGVGAYMGATYDPMDYVDDKEAAEQIRLENGDPNDYFDLPSRTDVMLEGAKSVMGSPTEYLNEGFDPYFLRTASSALQNEYKQGGVIEEVWEDELDDHTIALLRKAGYTVEELD